MGCRTSLLYAKIEDNTKVRKLLSDIIETDTSLLVGRNQN